MHLFNLAPSILHSTCIQQHLASMETLNYKSFSFAEEMRNTSSVVISCFYCPTYANANVYHAQVCFPNSHLLCPKPCSNFTSFIVTLNEGIHLLISLTELLPVLYLGFDPLSFSLLFSIFYLTVLLLCTAKYLPS